MLLNKTKGKLIAEKVRLAESSWEKLKGLMFEGGEKFDYALVFVLKRESIINATIHMMFVFFPIDVVYLNRDKKVVDVVKNLKPFISSGAPKKPSKYFIELPAGKSDGIKVGDELKW